MKRKRVETTDDSAVAVSSSKIIKTEEKDCPGGCEEVWDGINYLETQFPVGGFQTDPPLPSIVLRHQLYSLIQDRTKVDRDLMKLRDVGKVRMFQVGMAGQDYVLVKSDDYYLYLRKYLEQKGGVVRHQQFLKHVLPSCLDVFITERQLRTDFKITEGQISDLVRCGALLVREVDVSSGRSWWFSIPGLSPFVRSLSAGRRQLKQWLQRAPCSELLQLELEGRKWHASSMTILYHLHDLVGGDQLERVKSTSGPLIRLVQDRSR